MLFDPIVDGMILESVLYFRSLAIFSALCISFFILFGWLARSEAAKDRWKHVDLPYYIIGTLGVISLFSSTIETFSERALNENFILAKNLWESSVSLDPRLEKKLEELIIEQGEQLVEYEEAVRVGCLEKGVERLCVIPDYFQKFELTYGGFFESAKELDSHDEVCRLKYNYHNTYLGPAIDITDCWRFDDGDFEDSEYLQDHFSKRCETLSEKPPIQYDDHFNPGRPLSILNDNEKTDPRRFCNRLNEFEMTQNQSNRKIDELEKKLAESLERVTLDQANQRFWRSGLFQSLWPYFLILGFALKLGKWASTLREPIEVSRAQSNTGI